MARRQGARRASEPELIGAVEAAELIGVQQSNLRILRKLPEPYCKLPAGTFWRADEIREFAKARKSETTTKTTTEGTEAA